MPNMGEYKRKEENVIYYVYMYERWEISALILNHNLKMEQVVGIPAFFFAIPTLNVQRSFKQQ